MQPEALDNPEVQAPRSGEGLVLQGYPWLRNQGFLKKIKRFS